ncbi:MAG: TonB-dependent receptor, partial [Bacteroidota bacterium]
MVILIVSTLLSINSQAQQIAISGQLVNEATNEGLPFASLVIQGTPIFATSDENGFFEFQNLAPGLYNLEVSMVGFEPQIIYEIQTYKNKAVEFQITMVERANVLEEATVTARRTNEVEGSVALQNVGFAEIIRTPGGNRDVSKTLQILPGVASIDGFRNDIIIRGGASFENSFYLDGVKVPSINHFTTQGTGGGVWGLINADAIAGVDLYTGAFPVDRGDALSGVFDIRLKKGSQQKTNGNVVLGSSDLGFSLNGPIGKKTNYLLSARQAYLSTVFRLFDFAFLPSYRDFLLKLDHRFDEKNSLSFIALASDDNVDLNLDAKVDDSRIGEQNRVFLGFAPEFEQSSYSMGLVYKRYYGKGYASVIVSRSFLRNAQIKFLDNDPSDPNNLLLDYDSDEAENILRISNTFIDNGWRIIAGVEVSNSTFDTEAFRLISSPSGVVAPRIYDTKIDFMQYAFFGSISKKWLDNRLKTTFGIRTDFNNYNEAMKKVADQLSPRLSASYQISSNWLVNASMGRYYQLPPQTIMGFRDENDNLVNEPNLKYIRSDQLVAGLTYRNDKGFNVTLEGFYKKYDNYPFLLTDSISFTNIGVVSFGAIGDEPANSTAEGRAYGVEISARQKLRNGFFGLVTYTLSKSEFKDKIGEYKSTSWDYEHIANLTIGKKFKNNWELGLKFRLAGGTPYTPFDIETS